MSRKYQQIVNKTKGKPRKRVKLPQRIQDYITNLTVDMKEAQIQLQKITRVEMNIWQAFDSLKQIIRILRQKGLLGKLEDWRDLMCEDCRYKKKLMEDAIELELSGTIVGEVPQEMTFALDDWEIFLDKVKEKPPMKEIERLDEKMEDIIKNPKIPKKIVSKIRRIRCKDCEELYHKKEGHKCEST